MDWPLVRASGADLEERLDVLFWLIERAERLGIERIVLPFVDASRIDTDDELDQVCRDDRARASERAEDRRHRAPPRDIPWPRRDSRSCWRDCQRELVKVNYDIGNSASLGYDPREEFAAYGDRVGSVHIKDRVEGRDDRSAGDRRRGPSGRLRVPAGHSSYAGDFVMQVARGRPGDEVAWATRNRALTSSALRGRAAARGA